MSEAGDSTGSVDGHHVETLSTGPGRKPCTRTIGHQHATDHALHPLDVRVLARVDADRIELGINMLGDVHEMVLTVRWTGDKPEPGQFVGRESGLSQLRVRKGILHSGIYRPGHGFPGCKVVGVALLKAVPVPFRVDPTAVPAEVLPGSTDRRELGAHFNAFVYKPAT